MLGLLLSTLIPSRQGLLLNPELAWRPAIPSNPPVSSPPSSGVTDTSNCAWLFTCVLGVQTPESLSKFLKSQTILVQTMAVWRS